tara:strand:- start:60 stop:800 length:741 start_codon:yes stop_codon:yes gene_type:complete
MPINFKTTKEGHAQPLFPFAPMIMYAKLPMNLVRRLNKYVNKTIKNVEKAKNLDHSDHLVGKLSQEILIESGELNKHLDIFNEIIVNFLQTDLARNFRTLKENTGFGINYKSAWVVRQFAGEYNPAHIHTKCDMSCVGYLKLPEKIEEEWEEDYKDHYPANGHIEFLHGQPGKLHTHQMLIKPSVGDFFVFPSDLIHMVYPFKSEGERRSFSMNIDVSQQKLDKDGKPVTIAKSEEGHIAGNFELA